MSEDLSENNRKLDTITINGKTSYQDSAYLGSTLEILITNLKTGLVSRLSNKRRFTPQIPSDSFNLQNLNAYLKGVKGKKKREELRNEKTGWFWKDHDFDQDIDTDRNMSIADIEAEFDKPCYAGLKEFWPSIRNFWENFQQAVTLYRGKITNRTMELNRRITPASRITSKEPHEFYEVSWAGLCQNGEYPNSAEEDAFLYSHLRVLVPSVGSIVHGKELFWITEDGHSIRFAFDINYRLKKDEMGLNSILKELSSKFIDYCKKIEKIATEIRSGITPKSEEDAEVLIDAEIARQIPSLVYDNVELGLRYTKEEKTKEGFKPAEFRGYVLSLKTIPDTKRRAGSNYSKTDVTETICSKLYGSLDWSRLKKITLFSNEVGKGLCVIPLDGLDVDGKEGARAALDGKEPPLTPPYLTRLLFGKDGKCFFSITPKMSILRLAYYIVSVIDADVTLKQAMVLTGEADAGKSRLIDYLSNAFGPEFTANLPENDGNGILTGIVGKTFLICPEIDNPTNLINKNETFHRITGGDVIPVKGLYENIRDYKPEHARLVVATNKRIELWGMRAVKRVLPFVVQRVYDRTTMVTEKVIQSWGKEEARALFQWAFDTVAYYQNVRNSKDETFPFITANRIQLISDADFDSWLKGDLTDNGDLTLSEDALTARAFEELGEDYYRVTLSEDQKEASANDYATALGKLTFLGVTGKEEDVTPVADLKLAAAEFFGDPRNKWLATHLGCDGNIKKFVDGLKSIPGITYKRRKYGMVFTGMLLKHGEDVF